MKKKRKTLTEEEVVARLRTKYGDETKGWVVFEQVASGTGAMSRRYADAVAMNLWPSKGLEILGFEVKSSRGDWLRELRSRRKVEDGVYRYCDRWYVVAGGPGIVELDEVPKNWGLLEPSGRGLKVTKVAPELSPDDVERIFLACVLRRAATAKNFTSADALRAERNRGFEDGRKFEYDQVRYELERLRLVVAKTKEFEKASGISIEWEGDVEALGIAVKAVVSGNGKGLSASLNRVRRIEAMATELATEVSSRREAIEAVVAETEDRL